MQCAPGRPTVFAGLAALGLSLILTAPAAALDLLQSYQAGLANDPTFASARAANQAERERTPQARANLLPFVTGTAGREYNQVDAGPTSRSNHATTLALHLTQPLFDWAAWQNYEQAQLLVQMSESRLDQARQDLILRVSRAYFDVLAAQDDLTFIGAQKNAISQQLESAKRNFEIGTATITDTYEAQARYDLADAQQIQAESQLDLARSALRQLIGESPGALVPLRTDVEVSAPQPTRIEDWITQADTQNPTVIQSLLNTEVAARGIDIAKAGHYPTVALTASLSRNVDGHATTQYGTILPRGTTSRVAGVQVQVPVFSGFATTSRVTQSVAIREQARADLEAARRSVSQATRQAYLGVTSGLSQIRALQAAERSSRSALEANQTGYEVGVRINIDVLDAQQQLYSTQRDLARARYDALQSSLQLKAAVGMLGESDIDAINRLLLR